MHCMCSSMWLDLSSLIQGNDRGGKGNCLRADCTILSDYPVLQDAPELRHFEHSCMSTQGNALIFGQENFQGHA